MNLTQGQAVSGAVGIGALLALVQSLQDEQFRLIGFGVLVVMIIALVWIAHRSDPRPPPPQDPPKF